MSALVVQTYYCNLILSFILSPLFCILGEGVFNRHCPHQAEVRWTSACVDSKWLPRISRGLLPSNIEVGAAPWWEMAEAAITDSGFKRVVGDGG